MSLRLLLLLLFFLSISLGNAQSLNKEKIYQFEKQTGATVSLNKATKAPNFIKFPQGNALRLQGNNLEEKANNFFALHGSVLGLKDANQELIAKQTKTDQIGTQRLELEQQHQGVPVFGGKLLVHFDQQTNMTAINGVFIPEITVNTTPKISTAAAASIGIAVVHTQKNGTYTAALKAHQSKLFVFQKGLVQGVDGPTHLVYEVEVRNDADVREFVYVDAHKGHIVEQFTGMHSVLSRKVYEADLSTLIWQEGDAFPGVLDQWQQNEVVTSEHVYNFFFNAFGFESYDGAGAEMVTINNNPAISCPNANWNGATANYCTGTASDDVVGHEWGHAYTEFTNGLIYAYQSGALNESYSDVWGETIDLINAFEDTGEDLALTLPYVLPAQALTAGGWARMPQLLAVPYAICGALLAMDMRER